MSYELGVTVRFTLCKSDEAPLLLPLETVQHPVESWQIGWLQEPRQPIPWRLAYEFSTLGSP